LCNFEEGSPTFYHCLQTISTAKTHVNVMLCPVGDPPKWYRCHKHI